MTSVLVYEWCCSGAVREDSSRAASLWTEGWAMLAAAVADFRRVADVRVRTILDAGLRSEARIVAAVAGWPNVDVIWAEDEAAVFRTAAADADFALVIAPEFDRILETRCRWAVEAGAKLLGPSPEAVALTADKLELARHLESRRVSTPRTMPLMQSIVDFGRPPFVAKPRYGAGSQGISLMHCAIPDLGLFGEMIVQPLVPGEPCSVAFLIGARETIALMPALQDISPDGRFHYRGGSAPMAPELAVRASQIARRAIDTVPGLSGYVGVDVVLGTEADHVIEINPRLTTSFVGLRALAHDNLMEMLLGLVRGEFVSQPRWRSGSVNWAAAGDVTTGRPIGHLREPGA